MTVPGATPPLPPLYSRPPGRVKGRTNVRRKGDAQRSSQFDCGLYGDLQGIADRAMPEIEGLAVLMTEASSPRALE
jgi:hypothetical protein